MNTAFRTNTSQCSNKYATFILMEKRWAMECLDRNEGYVDNTACHLI